MELVLGVDGLDSGVRILFGAKGAGPRPGGPSTGRRENLLAILRELRSAPSLTRAEVAERTGLALPTTHRLLATLLDADLVVEDVGSRASGGLGRPSSFYRFNRAAASVAGVDVGGETTRVALVAADGTVIGSRRVDTDQVAEDLIGQISAAIASVREATPGPVGPLVGTGVGIAGTVDQSSGVMTRASLHQGWVGMPIRSLLEQALACPVVVEQDDHLSVLAEISEMGTAPGASSLVEINYGRGICSGAVIGGVVIKGVHGRAGRVAEWPSDTSPGQTVGDELAPDAMLSNYLLAGGDPRVSDVAEICDLARQGDPAAVETVRRSGASLAAVFLRLATVFDPQCMVFGGGLSGSFDLFEQDIHTALATLPSPPRLQATAIGNTSVVIGGLLAADPFMDDWLVQKVREL